MKDNRYFRNIALTIVLGLALAVCMVIRAMAPMAVLPQLDVPNVVLLSMIALLAEFYIAGEGKCSALTFVFAALTFGVLPLVAGSVEAMEALKLAVIGGVIFLIPLFGLLAPGAYSLDNDTFYYVLTPMK